MTTMSIRIAVVDPLPMFVRGIAATLGDAGFETEAPDDVIAWLREGSQHIVLLTLLTPPDWVVLGSLRRARADVTVIAALDQPEPAAAARAIVAGAAAVLPRSAPAATVSAALTAAIGGASLIPLDVLRILLAPGTAAAAGGDPPTEREVEWLRRLSGGMTVGELAAHSGYSERMMFRLLRALYRKLRVTTRTQAIMVAHTRGWI
jgi:DNA-binding NarL/FixJ family response regulator